MSRTARDLGVLDGLEAQAHLDKEGMLASIRDLPGQCRDAPQKLVPPLARVLGRFSRQRTTQYATMVELSCQRDAPGIITEEPRISMGFTPRESQTGNFQPRCVYMVR